MQYFACKNIGKARHLSVFGLWTWRNRQKFNTGSNCICFAPFHFPARRDAAALRFASNFVVVGARRATSNGFSKAESLA